VILVAWVMMRIALVNMDYDCWRRLGMEYV
jgi:hypothetical protein